MKLNTAWLLQYLDTPIDHRELIDAMPRAGLEVEAEAELKEALSPVRIGFVREKRPLDDAPGMFATKIEIERGQFISVLVGSEHEVQVGWGVPVAPAGMTLPTGKKVAAGNFHGVESTGMICLDGELGLIDIEGAKYFDPEYDWAVVDLLYDGRIPPPEGLDRQRLEFYELCLKIGYLSASSDYLEHVDRKSKLFNGIRAANLLALRRLL